jgi:peptidoglycan hydrolase CwlO-like protein
MLNNRKSALFIEFLGRNAYISNHNNKNDYMEQKSKDVREAEIRAKIAKLDAYVEEMNAKGNLTDEEWKEVWSAMQKTNKYLRAIGAPESEMYDI